MRRVYGIFWLPIARLHGFFSRKNRGFKEFCGCPDTELGISRRVNYRNFRVAESSDGGRSRIHEITRGRGLCAREGLLCARFGRRHLAEVDSGVSLQARRSSCNVSYRHMYGRGSCSAVAARRNVHTIYI